MADDVMAPPTPDASQLPAASGQNPMQQPAAQPPGPPSADQQHSWLGRGIRHIASALEGQEVSYQPDPNTGEAKEVVSPRKPGGLFRDILLGAIAGGAAGSPQKGQYSSGAAGLFKGAQAAMSAQQGRQQQAQQQAQGQAQKQKALNDQKAAQDKADQQAAATVAATTVNNLNYGKHIDMHSPENIQRHNLASDTVKNAALKQAGGTVPVIPGADGQDINGKAGNGPELMKMFNNDPSLMQGPEGFHRIPILHFDTTDMDHAPGKGYASGGKDVDPNEHVSVSFIDVPNASWGKNVQLTKGQVNDIAGTQLAQGKNTDSVTTTLGSLFSLGLKNTQELNAQHAEETRGPKDANEYERMKSELAGIKAKGDNATASEKRMLANRQPILDAYQTTPKNVTPEQDKIVTRQLEEKLKTGNISPEERTDLVTRQQEAKLQGIPSEIQSQVGKPPVPAQFPKGEDDQAYINLNKMWGKNAQKMKTQESTAGANIRVSAFGEVPSNVVDTKTGNMSIMTRDEIAQHVKEEPGRYLLATQDGIKVLSKQAAIGDIEYNLDNTRKTIGALDNLDAGTRMKLIASLRSPNPDEALKTFMTSEARSLSDPKVQDAIIALTSMAENVMLLRSVQGVGGAGSDMMRHALMDLVPSGASPSKGYANKQLDVLAGTLKRLKAGVPTTGVPAAQNSPATTPEAPDNTTDNKLPPVPQGFVRFKDSRGGYHDIPPAQLDAARKRDPKLTVLQ